MGTGDTAVKKANRSPSPGGVDILEGEIDKQATVNAHAPGGEKGSGRKKSGHRGKKCPPEGGSLSRTC